MFRQTVHLRGHTFLDRLRPESVVLDCGANCGEFTAAVQDRYDCRVYAFEPNPVLFDALPRRAKLTPLPYAVSGQDGVLDLKIGPNAEASSIIAVPDGHHSTVSVPVRCLKSLFEEFDASSIDLVKLDIEGAEVGVLLDTPDEVLMKIDQLCVEFHETVGYITPEQVARVIERMESLGFWTRRMTLHSFEDVLFVNRNRVNLSGTARLWISSVERFGRGIGRILRRNFVGRH